MRWLSRITCPACGPHGLEGPDILDGYACAARDEAGEISARSGRAEDVPVDHKRDPMSRWVRSRIVRGFCSDFKRLRHHRTDSVRALHARRPYDITSNW